jgi:CheY-like chemotaxis protein
MSDAIKKLEDIKVALEKKIDEFVKKPFETPEMMQSRYEGLIEQLKDTGAQLNRALANQAMSK